MKEVIDSISFIIKDCFNDYNKIKVVKDDDKNKGGLWCMVYRSMGIGSNPYDYGQMIFETDYSIDFCIHKDECDCTDECSIENYLEKLFNDKDFMFNIENFFLI